MTVVVEGSERALDTPSSEESGIGHSADDTTPSSEEEATLVVPPDGGWGWVVVAASFTCCLLVDGIVTSSGQFLDSIEVSLKVSKSRGAWVSSLLSGFYLLAGPVASALANRYGFRLVTIVGAVIASLAFSLSYFANSVEFLYVSYGIFGGLGLCLVYVPAVITVGFYFERWRALATGLSMCGSGIGTMILPPLTETLVKKIGWQSTIVVHGGIILIAILCAITFRPIQPVKISLTETSEEEEMAKRHEVAVEKLNSMMKLNQKLDSGLALPTDARFGHPATPHTWMGVPNNSSYPTAAEVFRGSSSNLNRRQSANSAVIRNQLNRPPRYIVVPVSENDENMEESLTSTTKIENTVPLLNGASKNNNVEDTQKRHHMNDRHLHRGSKASHINEPVNRPFYRDDIFFGGSLKRLPQYQSHTSVGYHMVVTHMPTKEDVVEEHKCKICPEAVRRTLATMLDISLFKSPTFVLMALSGFLTMLAFFVPFMYIKARNTQVPCNGTCPQWDANMMSQDATTWLVPTIGIANTLGRVMCGVLSSFDGISTLWINNIALTLGGVAMMASGIYFYPVYQFGFCAVFGLVIACFASLRSIMVVEFLGLERLTNAFGLLMLFQGAAACAGLPIAGMLYDATKSYDTAFVIAGGFVLLSAVLCYPMDYVSRWEKKKLSLAKTNGAV